MTWKTFPVVALIFFSMLPASRADDLCVSYSGEVDRRVLSSPIELEDGIGAETIEIPADSELNSAAPKAVAYYKQGMAQLHMFNYVDAIRSFNMALRIQPGLSMVYVGAALSFANGKLNATSSVQSALANAEIFQLSVDSKASPTEKMWIPVLQGKRAMRTDLKKAGERDAEVLTYLGWQSNDLEILKKAAELNPRHIGANHYLEHLYENAGDYKNALIFGEKVVKEAPNSWHAQHMLGHLYPMLGRWEDARRQFEISDKMSRQWIEINNARIEDEWHIVHNLKLYGIAEHTLGHLAKAEELLKEACSVKPFGENCLELVDFYLTENRMNDAKSVMKEKFAGVESGLYTDSTHIMAIVTSFWSETESKVAPPFGIYESSDLRLVSSKLVSELSDSKKKDDVVRRVTEALGNAGFDMWSKNLFVAKRMARLAGEAGEAEIVAQILPEIRKIDPAFAVTIKPKKSFFQVLFGTN